MSLLKMSPSPHEKGEENTSLIMGKVLIALLPALVWACIVFGFRSLTLTLVSVAACMGFEHLYCLLMKRKSAVTDLSAAVTGVLLAFNMPVSAPLWMPVIGGFFAIVIVKCLFGGIGKNIVNPALAARVFLLTSWTSEMTAFTAPKTVISPFAVEAGVDAVTSATPLVGLKNGVLPETPIFDLFIGNMPGCIGEVSSILLLAGGVYLIFSKVITWHIPVSYIATVAALTYFLPHGAAAFDVSFMLSELFSGGIIIAAVFMATDYATSPITPTGRIIYGIGCGLLTVFIRYFGGYPEGASFAVLIMNLFVWYLDRFTKPKVFGGDKK